MNVLNIILALFTKNQKMDTVKSGELKKIEEMYKLDPEKK